MVIDKTLIDIKCTNGNNDRYEILQLLGYTSLLNYNCITRVDKICIINILNGVIKFYDIKHISDDNLLEYLHLLTNKYEST